MLSADDRPAEPVAPERTPDPCAAVDSTPADELFAKVRELIERMDGPRTDAGVAEELQVLKKQAEVWFGRFAEGKIRELFKGADVCRTEAEIVESLRISRKQVRVRLKRLVEEGVLDRLSRPVRYRSTDQSVSLFDRRD